MLKKLIAALTRKLIDPKFNPGYQTRIYPTISDPIVIHDTLDFGPAITAHKSERINSFWHVEDAPKSSSKNNFWCDNTFDINPASGLPMAGDCLDVGGNIFGTSSSWLDTDSDLI